MPWDGSGWLPPRHEEDDDVSAFVRDETESTYKFLWRGLIVAVIFCVSIFAAGAVAVTIWKALHHV
jgi:hypothetical protein